MTTGFNEQVMAMEPAAAVHHEHHRGDVDGRQCDVDHSGNAGPDRGGRGTGVTARTSEATE
ncbi:hypothetical protein [Streptomyces sp. NPDC059649]|uniref:hypothetical protein n=1 Tax=Streptomyces sp. NPDC059649 TaxID=3346895 RepID=UPI0036906B82